MADMGEMNANLMGSSGFQAKAHERMIADRFDYFPVGRGTLTVIHDRA
jgi:hypothetical protein